MGMAKRKTEGRNWHVILCGGHNTDIYRGEEKEPQENDK